MSQEMFKEPKEISDLRNKLVKAIDSIPVTQMFGNEELIELLHQLNEEVELWKTGKKCPECNGRKFIEHDCDCEFCYTREVECENCGGKGIIKKEDL